MTTKEQFFFNHAGYSYHPETETPEIGRKRSAKRLAQAESFAENLGLVFHYETEPDPDLSWMSPEEQAEPHHVICIWVKHPKTGQTASLGNIVDADENYLRVIEAELASELMD